MSPLLFFSGTLLILVIGLKIYAITDRSENKPTPIYLFIISTACLLIEPVCGEGPENTLETRFFHCMFTRRFVMFFEQVRFSQLRQDRQDRQNLQDNGKAKSNHDLEKQALAADTSLPS